MKAAERRFEIADELTGIGVHDVAIHYQVAPDVNVTHTSAAEVLLQLRETRICLSLDPRLTVTLLRGSESPIAGWASPGYHRKSPATTIRATIRAPLPLSLGCRIQIEPAGQIR